MAGVGENAQRPRRLELIDLPALRNATTLRLCRNQKRRAMGIHRLDVSLSEVVEAHERHHGLQSGRHPGGRESARGLSPRVITPPA